MHAILYDIFLIFLANVCRYCQTVLTAWIHSCILSFRSVDMYKVCHIHLWKIYHAGIEISNIILSKGRLISPTFNKTTYTFDETTFFQKSRLLCTAAAIPNQFSFFINRSLSMSCRIQPQCPGNVGKHSILRFASISGLYSSISMVSPYKAARS